MIAIQITCRRCSSEAVKKNGSVNGRPKYRCSTCHYQGYFESRTAERAAKYALVEQLLLERNSQRSIVDKVTGEMTMHFITITTEPNSLTADLQDRMPAILPIGAEMDWLKQQKRPEDYLQMLQPLDPKLMQAYSVSKEVGKIHNNYPELIQPFQYPAQPEQLNLF